MHWLAGLVTAALLWGLLEFLALRWGGPSIDPSVLLHGGAAYLLFGAVARFLRYVIPSIFVLGAGVSLFAQIRRRGRYRSALQDPTQLLEGMTWLDFEKVVADAFIRNGYEVQEKGGAQADGGVDLVLRRSNKRYLVQCKQWRGKVPVTVVRELLGIMAASAADGGFVVAAGGFTKDASQFAQNRTIQLIDRAALASMMRGQPSPGPAAIERVNAAIGAPACPQCNKVMIKRVATRGRGAGEPFWGCVSFPACRGTRSIV